MDTAPVALRPQTARPGRMLTRFSFKQVRRGALILGVVFAIAAVSQSVGLVKAYPDEQARGNLIASLKNNIGLRVLFGSSEHLDSSVARYVEWRTIGIMTIIGSIWAMLVTTRALRGEEEAGRWEVVLSSPLTARRATGRVLLGILGSLPIVIGITGLALTLAGQPAAIGLPASGAFLYALTIVLGALMFVAVGALASQLAPLRQRAAMLAGAFLGVSFLVRAITNTTESAHWLRNVNPLSWVDNIQPFTGQHYLWLIPVISFTILLVSIALYLSGRRDLGASFIPESDSAKPRLALLRSPVRFGLRLSRGPMVSWMAVIAIPSTLFGILAVTATGALNASGAIADALSKVFGGQSASMGIKLFLGMGFLILTIVLMSLAAAAVQAIRKEEAHETLDNLLVRPVQRLQWLGGRTGIVVVWIIAAALWAGLVCWIAASSQGAGLAYGTFLEASLNMMTPALFVMGTGLAAFGFWPRLTSTVMYGVIGWSFLVEILGSLLNLPAWVINSSLLHHVAAVPAVAPQWDSTVAISALGLLLASVGAWRFNRRDLQNE